MSRKMLYILTLFCTVQMFTEVNVGAKKKEVNATAEITTAKKKRSKKAAQAPTEVAGTTRETLKVPNVIKNITFLKSFHPSDMTRLKNLLQANNNAPFTILDAFIVQPMFLNIQYDITAAIQAHASAGLLCLPQNLKAFIGNQGTEPYMYIAKILFIMNDKTYNLCYRNDFLGTPVTKHASQFNDMVTTCSPHIYLP